MIEEKNEIHKLVYVLMALAILLIPFNNLPYLNNILKELSFSATSYPMLILMTIMVIYILKESKIVKVKDKSIYILITFVILCFIFSLFNISEIMTNSFKGKTGIRRFVFQYPMLAFGAATSYCFYYFLRRTKITLWTIRRWVLFSTIIASAYGFIEMLNMLNIIDTSEILKAVSKVIQLYARGELYPRGIRTVCGEASYFGMYAAFVLPWILSYIYTEKEYWKKGISVVYALYFIALVLLSKSRMGLLIFWLEFIIFAIGIIIMRGNWKKKIITVLLFPLVFLTSNIVNKVGFTEEVQYENTASNATVGAVVESLNDENNMSNVARFSMMKAAFRIGNQHLLTGVGVGQYAFYATDNVEPDDYRSSEITRWLDPERTQYWPTVFALHARIYAENGIICFLIWVGLWAYIGISLLIRYIKYNDIKTLILMSSVAGVLLACFNVDTYIYYPLWILIGLYWRFGKENIEENSGERDEEIFFNYGDLWKRKRGRKFS